MNIQDVITDYANREPPVHLKVHDDLPGTFLEATLAHHEWAFIKRKGSKEEHLTCVMVLGPTPKTSQLNFYNKF